MVHQAVYVDMVTTSSTKSKRQLCLMDASTSRDIHIYIQIYSVALGCSCIKDTCTSSFGLVACFLFEALVFLFFRLCARVNVNVSHGDSKSLAKIVGSSTQWMPSKAKNQLLP